MNSVSCFKKKNLFSLCCCSFENFSGHFLEKLELETKRNEKLSGEEINFTAETSFTDENRHTKSVPLIVFKSEVNNCSLA